MKMTNAEQALLSKILDEMRYIEKAGLCEWLGMEDATEETEIALCERLNEIRLKVEAEEEHTILTEREIWEAVEGHPCEDEEGFERYIEAYINATPEDERTNENLDQYLEHL